MKNTIADLFLITLTSCTEDDCIIGNNNYIESTSMPGKFDQRIILNGLSDIEPKGKSQNQSVITSGSGYVDLNRMQTRNMAVRNNSSGRVRAIATKNAVLVLNYYGNIEIDSFIGLLKVEINCSGNLVYSSNPSNVKFLNSGSKKLIKNR